MRQPSAFSGTMLEYLWTWIYLAKSFIKLLLKERVLPFRLKWSMSVCRIFVHTVKPSSIMLPRVSGFILGKKMTPMQQKKKKWHKERNQSRRRGLTGFLLRITLRVLVPRQRFRLSQSILMWRMSKSCQPCLIPTPVVNSSPQQQQQRKIVEQVQRRKSTEEFLALEANLNTNEATTNDREKGNTSTTIDPSLDSLVNPPFTLQYINVTQK